VDDAAEQQWIQQAQTGDRQAFAALVDRYWPRIFHWLAKMTHDSHAAEDLTQEVFLKAWSATATFDKPTAFRAWLFRIASNCLIDVWRDPRSGRARPLPETASSRERSPVAVLVGQESQVLVQEACDRLPPLFRAALLLRAQENFSGAEIAAILNINEKTVRWRLFKARQMLLEQLEQHLNGVVP